MGEGPLGFFREPCRILDSRPLTERIANALVSYISYMRKMVWPNDLAVFYPHPGGSLPWWEVVGTGLVLVTVSVFAVRTARRHPYLPVGWFWYLGTLVPVLGLVQVGAQGMADRFVYVPLNGLFVMAAWGVPALLGSWPSRRIFMAVSAAVVLCAFSVCTWSQARYWRNSESLFERAAQVNTDNYLAHNNLGAARLEQGRIEEGIAHISEALRIKPTYAMALSNMGGALVRQGRFQEAIERFSKALEIRPGFAEAHNNLGIALAKEGRLREAIHNFSKALEVNPDYLRARKNLEVARRLEAEVFQLGVAENGPVSLGIAKPGLAGQVRVQ